MRRHTNEIPAEGRSLSLSGRSVGGTACYDDGVDHLLVACRDLDLGIRYIADILGTAPEIGGSHPNSDTINALVSLSETTYLEVIAPNKNTRVGTAISQRLQAFGQPVLAWWSARVADVELLRAKLLAQRVPVSGIVNGERHTAAGGLLQWRLLFLKLPDLGAAAPFFIEWSVGPHPAQTAIRAAVAVHLDIQHPNASQLAVILETAGMGRKVTLKPGLSPSVRAIVEMSGGEKVILRTHKDFFEHIPPLD